MTRSARAVRLAAALAVSSGLLYVTLRQADWSTIEMGIPRIQWSWVLLGFFSSFAVLCARIQRLRVLYPDADVVTLGSITSVQNFLVRVTPFRLGELSFPMLLQRHLQEPPARSMAYLLVIRLLELWFLVGAGLLASLLALELHSAARTSTLLSMFGVVTLAMGTSPAWLPRALQRSGQATAVLPDRLRSRPRFVKLVRQLAAAIDALTSLTFRQQRRLAIHTLSVVVLQYLMLTALAASVGVTMSPWQAIIGISLAQAASALPLATVGTFGSYEAGWVFGFALIGISWDAAVISGVASQLMTLVFAVFYALPAVALLRPNKPQNADAILK